MRQREWSLRGHHLVARVQGVEQGDIQRFECGSAHVQGYQSFQPLDLDPPFGIFLSECRPLSQSRGPVKERRCGCMGQLRVDMSWYSQRKHAAIAEMGEHDGEPKTYQAQGLPVRQGIRCYSTPQST